MSQLLLRQALFWTMRVLYPGKVKQATFLIVYTPLPPQLEIDLSRFFIAPTGLHGAKR